MLATSKRTKLDSFYTLQTGNCQGDAPSSIRNDSWTIAPGALYRGSAILKDMIIHRFFFKTTDLLRIKLSRDGIELTAARLAL